MKRLSYAGTKKTRSEMMKMMMKMKMKIMKRLSYAGTEETRAVMVCLRHGILTNSHETVWPNIDISSKINCSLSAPGVR